MSWGLTGPAETAEIQIKDCSGALQSEACAIGPFISARWIPPSEYTNGSPVFLSHHKFNYGLVSGVLDKTVDLSTTSVKGAIRHTVGGLTEGLTYYYSITSVDAYGNETTSAESSAVARAEYQPDLGAATEINGPISINSAGVYKIGQSFTAAGTAIQVGADNVEIYNPDGHIVTYADSVAGYGVEFTSSVSGHICSGLNLIQGSFIPSSGGDYTDAFRASSKSISGRFDGNTMTLSKGGTSSNLHADGFGFRGLFSSSVLEITNNTIIISGGSARYGIFLEGSPDAYIHGNNISISGTDASVGTSRCLHLFGGRLDVSANLVSFDPTVVVTGRCISVLGGQNAVIHDNTVNNQGFNTQALLVEDNSQKTIVTHNSLTSNDNSAYRERFEASGSIVGFNVCYSDSASGINVGGVDALNPGPTTGGIYYMNNTSSNLGRGFRFFETTEDIVAIDNIISSTSTQPVLVQGANEDGVLGHTNLAFVGNSISGVTSEDISLLALSALDNSTTNASFSESSGEILEGLGIHSYTSGVDAATYRPTGLSPKTATSIESL